MGRGVRSVTLLGGEKKHQNYYNPTMAVYLYSQQTHTNISIGVEFMGFHLGNISKISFHFLAACLVSRLCYIRCQHIVMVIALI